MSSVFLSVLPSHLLKSLWLASVLALGSGCVAFGAAPPANGKAASSSSRKPAPPASNPRPAPPVASGAAPLRRLTRAEYDHTLRDLIGVAFDSQETVGMPGDEGGQGYDNLAAALNMPPALMEKYIAAADNLLDRVCPGLDGHVPDQNDRDRAQKAHDALFFAHPAPTLTRHDAARQILARFARRAWRRPVTTGETDALLRLADMGEKRGEPFETSLRPALKLILISPYFLYRVEGGASDPRSGQANADEYALASRLSYFLWASMPDDTLLALAEQHKLSDPAVLAQQTRRMLADPRARALTDDFAAQWLQTGKLATARPSTDFFPTFNTSVREAMAQESALFFDSLRTEDKSLLDLLDADYAYLNEDLAAHYEIKGVTGKQMRLVKLRPEDHRGGLLGMGSVLAMTSHTYRTSPTLRGKWVLDVIFGTPPPPPPPGVSVIVDEQKKQKDGATFRDLLTAHARQPNCAVCHVKMDPLGFALENYDAVGRWRAAKPGQPLDTSAQLPTGEKLNGALELKQIVVRRKDAFIRNLCGQMLAYALGRNLEASDAATLNRLAADVSKNQYKFSALLVGIVQSAPFRGAK